MATESKQETEAPQETAAEIATGTGEPARSADRQGTPAVRWDDSKMVSAYANVCNVAITREEFALIFGTNQTWNNSQKEIVIDLNTRIMMNPYAAKRLTLLLANYVREYEARFGELKLDGGRESAGKQ